METQAKVEILLVEDNPHDAELIIRELKQRHIANYLVWLKDGAAALKFIFGEDVREGAANITRPKVILLDLKLPKVDGLEVLRQLKANHISKAIPVVMMTSSCEEPDLARAYELGVNSYIVKPVNFDNFTGAVAQLGLYWLLLNQPLDHPPAASPRPQN